MGLMAFRTRAIVSDRIHCQAPTITMGDSPPGGTWAAIRRPFSFWPVSRLLLIITALSFVSGCSTIYRTTGWFAYDFTEDYAIPYSLKGNDPQMACGLATAMTPALMSFTELTYTPDRAAVSMYMMAGSCAEEKAQKRSKTHKKQIKHHKTTKEEKEEAIQ